jgi:hypothetical protein
MMSDDALGQALDELDRRLAALANGIAYAATGAHISIAGFTPTDPATSGGLSR